MTTLLDDARNQILLTLREAKTDVVTLRDATRVKPGYMGFKLAGTTLGNCHEAISGERDKARIVVMLKKAAGALALIGGGDAAPAVERTQMVLKDILQVLASSAPLERAVI